MLSIFTSTNVNFIPRGLFTDVEYVLNEAPTNFHSKEYEVSTSGAYLV